MINRGNNFWGRTVVCVCVCVLGGQSPAAFTGTKMSSSNFFLCAIRGQCDSPIILHPLPQKPGHLLFPAPDCQIWLLLGQSKRMSGAWSHPAVRQHHSPGPQPLLICQLQLSVEGGSRIERLDGGASFRRRASGKPYFLCQFIQHWQRARRGRSGLWNSKLLHHVRSTYLLQL